MFTDIPGRMIYLWLALAVAFEVGWAVAMKLSHGLTRPWPTVATIVMYLLSVVFLSLATKRLDVGVAYAIWGGCGISLIAIVGMTYFREPVTAMKIASIGLIVIGVISLQIASGGELGHGPAAMRDAERNFGESAPREGAPNDISTASP